MCVQAVALEASEPVVNPRLKESCEREGKLSVSS